MVLFRCSNTASTPNVVSVLATPVTMYTRLITPNCAGRSSRARATWVRMLTTRPLAAWNNSHASPRNIARPSEVFSSDCTVPACIFQDRCPDP